MIVTVARAVRTRILLFFAAFVVMVLCIGGWLFTQHSSTMDRSKALQVTTTAPHDALELAASPDFFIEYRLERDKVRSERSDVLREIIKNSKNYNARLKAQDTVLKMVQDKQRELEIENMIKSRGFSDALVFIRDDSISAVVKGATLSRDEVLKVAEIIHQVAGVKVEDINISAKP
ncbi:stage III sporulation protein AH [Sporomusaceae bacterium BoRhaA]|uniref:SpoIIIAH-like family protein n=1 Tax=Pelorhabdus rhamnosifermentans TaxID=2772457 RepID=UPI001FE2B53E|nr:SpoIIIAH-like family protein [Pelorhabdus rhamnosifermentans]MBU2700936.1 stage III sporulation protein AH [Pelorhabdus rhamnosifermentans]